MREIIYPEDMRASEQRYFASGAARSIDIMENAAAELAKAVRALACPGSLLRFACGTGGNGGDGTACARLLCGEYRCEIVLTGEAKTPDAVTNLARARALGLPVYTAEAAAGLPRPDVWIDAMLGTGVTGKPRGTTAQLIGQIMKDKRKGAKVAAADIPSGLNGKTGIACECHIEADATVTFGWLKPGLVLADGLDACGKLTIADVGFPVSPFGPFIARLADADFCREVLPRRPRNLHKNRCGHLLIVAGSRGMAGAAVMCASAALRSGAGLVTVACPDSILPILQARVPQAMCVPLPEKNGALSAKCVPLLKQALEGKTAAVIGCGLSGNAAPEVTQTVLDAKLPTVVDADGLNLLSRNPALIGCLHEKCVLTPHPGEALRFLRSLSPDMRVPEGQIAAARVLRVYGAAVLLKGASTVIADKEDSYISVSGCAGMARGGSGDILSGILGALLADPNADTPARAAACASELHGLAGELAQQKYGERAMNAMDILEFLPEVFKTCTPT